MFSHKKKVLALAGAIANLSLSVCVAGVATYAWFCENNVVHSTGMRIRSEGPEILINSYTILKYDDDLKKGVAYHNNADEFYLPDYDEYIKARNVYSNIIIRAELEYSKGLDTSSEAVEIDITKLASSTLKDANGIRQLTSNVAQFKCITTSYTPFNSNTVIPIGVGIEETKGDYKDVDDAMYRTSIAYFATRKTPSTFISLMNGQPVDPDNGNTITIVPELYNVGTIKGAVVYIECSYNEQLASGFVADHPDEQIHNLVGDIDSISFAIRPFNAGEFGQHNTGKYLRMSDVGRSYDGKYLASYTGNDSESVLDGSKATGSETIGSSSGINTNNNNYAVSNYMANNKSSVYASDRIDDASLSFNRRNGTYQSEDGYYIGNNTSTAGIISNASSEGLTNSLDYNSNNALVKSTVNTNMQLKYDTTNEKYAYYNNTNSDISLYRFHENDMIDATLSSLSVTGPTGQAAQYSVGEYFSLRGVACIATYTRGNSSFTINVNSMCTYTTSPEGTLEPDKSIFSASNPNKTINVTYTDRGVTKTGSFTLSIIEDVIEYIEITSPATHTTYIKGDTFDITGLQVTGTFTVNGQVDVTSQCIFKINDVTYTPGATLNISGDNLYVYIVYNGNATHGTSYQDRRYTISIKEYVCQIDEENENILLNESIGLSLTFNSTVVWEITGTAGAVSFSSSEVVTTHTTTYTGSNWANQTETVTVYGLAGGQCTVTAKIQGRDSVRDTCIVRVLDGSNLYATYVIASSSSVTTTGLPPQYSTADFVNTYTSNKQQLTGGNSMTLTLHGYTGYKITGITLSMHSNKSSGAGSFSAVAGGSTIASISTNPFNDASWHGDWSQNDFVDVTPTITLQKAIRQGQDVVLTITATVNSLFCQSFTINYAPATDAYATSLTVYDKDSNEIQNNGTITLNSGAVGDTYLPSADVTYSDSTSNHDVTWAKSGSGNATISQQNGLITFNATSGSITITVTTNALDQNDQAIVKIFTVTWSNFTRKLSSITVTNYTDTYVKDSQFAFDGTVTAYYNDNSEQEITSGYSVDTSLLNMATAGIYNVSVSYSEGGITKTVTIQITVTDGSTPPSYTYVRVESTAGLASGDIILLGRQARGHVAGVKSGDVLSAVTATFSNTTTITDKGDGIEFTATSTNDGWTLTSSEGQLYTSTAKKINYSSNGVGTWNITVSDGVATIECTDTSKGNIQYNYNSGNARFVNYTSSQETIEIYKKTTGGTPPTPTKTLSSIALSGTYSTTFTEGSSFNHTGMTVTATYSDATTADVTASATFSGYDMSTPGTQTVTVSYTESGVTETATYTITVTARTLSSIAVGGTPKTTFTLGEDFSFGSGTVTATYDNLTTKDVTASATFSGYNKNTLGEQTITVSYTEGGVTETTSYTITVVQSVTPPDTETDTLTYSLIGVTGTSYTAWTGKSDNSGSSAVYAGQSAGGNSSIQLRATNPSGIVTTASGGKAVKIIVVWESHTANGRTLDIYGKNTAYTSGADLYSNSTQGTKIGSIVYGTSTELVIEGDYEYIGIRSNNGALYLESVQIIWEVSD